MNTKTRRSYGQFCGLTRAADLLGNRWALPIVRDLLLGPRRFTDLQQGLPGIPTNMLTARLQELESDGIVRRVIAKPRGIQYELTEWGSELEPVITALGRWGGARMEHPAEGEVVTEAVLASALRTCFAGRRQAAPRSATTFEVNADSLAAHATVAGNTITVDTGPADDPALRIPAGEQFRALLAGTVTAEEYAAAAGMNSADAERLQLFTELFHLPLNSTSKESADA